MFVTVKLKFLEFIKEDEAEKILREKLIQETKNSILEFKREDFPRSLHGIIFGEGANSVLLSVQASSHTCSIPNKTLEDLSEYKAMEIALMNIEGFSTFDKLFPQFQRGFLANNLREHYSYPIYKYVPVVYIQQLFEILVREYGCNIENQIKL